MWDILIEYKLHASMFLAKPWFQFVVNVTDPSLSAGSISGEFYDDVEILSLVANKGKIDAQTMSLVLEAHRCRLFMLYLQGMYSEAESDAVRHRRLLEPRGSNVYKFPRFFVSALTSLAAARAKGKKKAPKAKKYVKLIEQQNTLGAPDVPTMLAFVKAETMSLDKTVDVTEVTSQYRLASTLLQKGRFHLLEAKALERLAEFLLCNPGHEMDGRQVLSESWAKYKEYGAFCMRHVLRQAFGDNFIEMKPSDNNPKFYPSEQLETAPQVSDTDS